MDTNYNPWYYYVGNKLIKKPKPCLPGSRVHISTMFGCFTVQEVHIDHFIVLKDRKPVKVEWKDFLFLEGEGKSPEAMLRRDLSNAMYMLECSITSQKKTIEELETQLIIFKQKRHK